METLKIAIIMGGWSHETNEIVTFMAVAHSIKELGWEFTILNVTDANFIRNLIKTKPNVAFITNQGAYGEDGKLQGLMEILGIKYTGSGVCASAVGVNKFICKQVFKGLGINTPRGRLLTSNDFDNYENIIEEFGSPFILKPLMTGSSFGVHLILSLDDFLYYGPKNLNIYGSCLIEEFIDGNYVEYSTGILEDDEKLYELPICQSILQDKLYSYECKFNNSKNKKIVDPEICRKIKDEMIHIAKQVHLEIGCSGLSRTDLILDKKNRIFALEFNTIPGLLPTSIFPKICEFEGIGFTEMVKRIVLNAFVPKKMEISKI